MFRTDFNQAKAAGSRPALAAPLGSYVQVNASSRFSDDILRAVYKFEISRFPRALEVADPNLPKKISKKDKRNLVPSSTLRLLTRVQAFVRQSHGVPWRWSVQRYLGMLNFTLHAVRALQTSRKSKCLASEVLLPSTPGRHSTSVIHQEQINIYSCRVLWVRYRSASNKYGFGHINSICNWCTVSWFCKACGGGIIRNTYMYSEDLAYVWHWQVWYALACITELGVSYVAWWARILKLTVLTELPPEDKADLHRVISVVGDRHMWASELRWICLEECNDPPIHLFKDIGASGYVN